MEALFPIMAVSAFLALLGSMIACAIPIPRVLPTRRKAAKAAAISFAIFVLGVVLSPKAPNATSESAAVPSNQQSTPAVSIAAQTADLAHEANQTWEDIAAAGKSCDDDHDAVVDAMKKGNPYDIYPAVQTAVTDCNAAVNNVAAVQPPASVSGRAKDAFEKAISDCSDSYGASAASFDKLGTVINGDETPASVTNAKQYAEAANYSQVQCATSFFSALTASNISPDAIHAWHEKSAQ